MGNRNLNTSNNSTANFWKTVDILTSIFRSVFYAFKFKTLPKEKLIFASSFVFLLQSFGLGAFLFNLLSIDGLYPTSLLGKVVMTIIFSLFPFVGWAICEGLLLIRFERGIADTLTIAGLRNVFGKTPRVIGVFPVDEETKKLVLSKTSFSLNDFIAAKPRIESGLKVLLTI
jgi:hypothetical protein